MRKKINLENGDKILIASYSIASGNIFRIYKSYFENEEMNKFILFSMFDGFLFEGTIVDEIETRKMDSLSFVLKQSDPLYQHFNNLLGEDKLLVLNDDNEKDTKSLSIYKSEYDIILFFQNRCSKTNVMNKFTIFTKSYNNQELEFRLREFFDGIKDDLLEEKVKQKIYKK